MHLLLDAHLSLSIVSRLAAEGVDVVSLQDWRGGIYRHAADELILEVAKQEARVLVTYDRRTFPPVVKRWGEGGLHHSGVVLIDDRTIRQDDIGGLIRALRALVFDEGEQEWDDRIFHLRPADA